MKTYEEQMKERIIKAIESVDEKSWETAEYDKETVLMDENVDNFYAIYENYRKEDGHLGVYADIEDFVFSTLRV